MRPQAAKQVVANAPSQQQQGAGAPVQRLKPILKSVAPVNQTNIQGQIQSQKPQLSQPQQQSNNGLTETPETHEKMDANDTQEIPRWKRKTPGCKLLLKHLMFF